MSPDNALAFLAFLVLVAPGLLYEILRERRHPGYSDSAFREASRVAFTSMVFSGSAFASLLLIRLFEPGWFPDPDSFFSETDYVSNYFRLVARFLVVQVGLSCAVAGVVSRFITRRTPGNIRRTSVWWEVFRGDRPAGKVPWVYLQLDGDIVGVQGFLSEYTPEQELENRELSLRGPKLKVRRKDETGRVGEWKTLSAWNRIVVRGDAIKVMQVSWQAAATAESAPARVFLPEVLRDARIAWAVCALSLVLLAVSVRSG